MAVLNATEIALQLHEIADMLEDTQVRIGTSVLAEKLRQLADAVDPQPTADPNQLQLQY
jgi:hypothetical protein